MKVKHVYINATRYIVILSTPLSAGEGGGGGGLTLLNKFSKRAGKLRGSPI